MQHDYASGTDCLLQNLSTTVGNPSARCYANAPWRAFTWTCALLQEQHPTRGNTARGCPRISRTGRGSGSSSTAWTTKSLDTTRSQCTRRCQPLRELLIIPVTNQSVPLAFAEIREGGYLLTMFNNRSWCHILMIGREDVTFQELINGWANQGMCQYRT